MRVITRAGGRGVGLEVRTQHDDPQPRPEKKDFHKQNRADLHDFATQDRRGPPVGVVEGAARRRLRERRPRGAGPGDEPGAVGGHLVEGVGPGVDRRAGARRRRRRRPRAGRRGRCTPPACRGPSPRAPARRSPRTRDGNTSASASAISPSRSASDTRPGRTTRWPSASAGDRPRSRVVGRAAPAEQDERRGRDRSTVRPAGRAGSVTLVRVGDRRVHEHPPVAEAVPGAELGGGRRDRAAAGVDAVGHHHDPVPLDAEGVDHGVARRSRSARPRRRPAHRSRHLTLEVPAPDRREVLRVASRYCRSWIVSTIGRGGPRRHRAAAVVDDVDVAGATGQPRRFGDEPAGPPGRRSTSAGGRTRSTRSASIGVGGGETGRHDEPSSTLRRHLGQPGELADEVLLGAADRVPAGTTAG